MVSIPSLHFFRWADQLKDSGHEVFWFDISGMAVKSDKLSWLHQKVNWKLKYNFPGRIFAKTHFPKTYKFLQRYNEYETAAVFEKYLSEIQPDAVHSFALQLSGLSILPVMNKYRSVKWIFSSWGSDVFYSKEIGIEDNKAEECFKRIDYLITDCNRDYKITLEKGFMKTFLGVFPGNGGVNFDTIPSELNDSQRKIILIKGYNDEIGRGINIVKAFDEELISLVENYEVVIFGADETIQKYIAQNNRFNKLKCTLYLKNNFISNVDLISLMGTSYIYIGNSLSDGIPNALIEAMGMGAFPIQSNPGRVTEEIIENGVNGFLINDAEDIAEIKRLIIKAINNKKIITRALLYNIENVRNKYDRVKVREQILKLYGEIACEINK